MARLSSPQHTPKGAGPVGLAPSRCFSGIALAGLLALAGCSGRGSHDAVLASHDAGLRLSPEHPNAASRISVVFDDARLGAAVSRYEWLRNGAVIATGEANQLEPTMFAKHDEIAVVVTAADPKSGAQHALRASIHVLNTPPSVTRVSLVVPAGTANPVIHANTECADPDGDAPSFTYRWLHNGTAIDGATEADLPLARIARGEQVVVEVTAHDDESASPPVRSEPFSVENRPPVFSSQPFAPRSSDLTYEYQASATDPDGDKLRYELANGPAGMTVDATGKLQWTLPTGDEHQGDFPVRIRAVDANGGEGFQDFVVHLELPSAKPAAAAAAAPAPATPQPSSWFRSGKVPH